MYPKLNPNPCPQPVTGADADELVAEFRDEERGSLFRLEGAGPDRRAAVTSARSNEHQLEKVGDETFLVVHYDCSCAGWY